MRCVGQAKEISPKEWRCFTVQYTSASVARHSGQGYIRGLADDNTVESHAVCQRLYFWRTRNKKLWAHCVQVDPCCLYKLFPALTFSFLIGKFQLKSSMNPGKRHNQCDQWGVNRDTWGRRRRTQLLSWWHRWHKT